MKISLMIEKLQEVQSQGCEYVYSEQLQDYKFYPINKKDLIITTKDPIGTCNRTGGVVFESEVKGYKGYSPTLDEDLFNFEYEVFNKN